MYARKTLIKSQANYRFGNVLSYILFFVYRRLKNDDVIIKYPLLRIDEKERQICLDSVVLRIVWNKRREFRFSSPFYSIALVIISRCLRLRR